MASRKLVKLKGTLESHPTAWGLKFVIFSIKNRSNLLRKGEKSYFIRFFATYNDFRT